MVLEKLVYLWEKRWFSKRFTREDRDGSRLPWFAHENRDGSLNAGLLARTEMILELLVYSREQRSFSNHSFTYEKRGGSRNGLLTRTEMVLDTLVSPREQRWFLKLWFTCENRDDSRNFSLFMSTKMVIETLVYSPFSHLMRLLARERFVFSFFCWWIT